MLMTASEARAESLKIGEDKIVTAIRDAVLEGRTFCTVPVHLLSATVRDALVSKSYQVSGGYEGNGVRNTRCVIIRW